MRSARPRLRADDGLDPLVIPTAAPTRVILTVRTESSAEQSAFFDPDPAIDREEAERMQQAVEQAPAAGDVDALTLSGSSPSPATHELYQRVDRAGPGAARPGLPRYLRAGARRDLGILADGDAAQSPRGRRPPPQGRRLG